MYLQPINSDPIAFSLNSEGKYFLAKHHNSGAKNFSQLQSRGIKAENDVPGPGAYDMSRELMSSDGRYTSSKMHSSLVRKFGSSLRSDLNSNSLIPGPGNYKLPSEFGHYISKDADKNSKTNTKMIKSNEIPKNENEN